MAKLQNETPLIVRAARVQLARMMPQDMLEDHAARYGVPAMPFDARKRALLATLVAANREGRLCERERGYIATRGDSF